MMEEIRPQDERIREAGGCEVRSRRQRM